VKHAIAAILFVAWGLLGMSALPATSRARAAEAPPAASNPVVEWNRFLLRIQATAGDQPATVHPTYELAVMHAAIYDAVVAIDRSGRRGIASRRASRSPATTRCRRTPGRSPPST
jgi:hypothetical protein